LHALGVAAQVRNSALSQLAPAIVGEPQKARKRFVKDLLEGQSTAD